MTRVPTTVSDYGVPASKRWKLGEMPWRDGVSFPEPQTRVLIDNDWAGDPDDLYQLVHHLLSPSHEIRGIISSRLRDDDPFDDSGKSATNGLSIAKDVFARMGLESTELLFLGSDKGLTDVNTPQDSEAAQAIIAEAMRDDVDTELFYLAGGGLTDLASALLLEPRIAERMKLIWIGGNEHDGLATPPLNAMPIEYNLLIDVPAGQVVFATSDLEIWQIPRNIYRQCLVTDVELRRRVRPFGQLGEYLYDEIAEVLNRVIGQGRVVAESYALGDSPLVLLTALRSTFETDTSSSFFVEKPTPHLTSEGAYRSVRGERPMRVYTQVDVRLMFEDFYLKLEEFVNWQQREETA